MLPQSVYEEIKKLLGKYLGQNVTTVSAQPVGGGSINQCYKLTFSNSHTLFCKVNSRVQYPDLFIKEQAGLQLLHRTSTIATPKVIACTENETHQVLLLEWIESSQKTKPFFQNFGKALAHLHGQTQDSFGLDYNNYMGSVPQQNNYSQNWPSFFIEQRLKPLVQQSSQQQLLSAKEYGLFEKLYSRLPQLFEPEKPSLLHGDLWSGNYMCGPAQTPYLIDPAVYYGHRSADLAMTTLFGGFDKAFYEAYHYYNPLPHNYQTQWQVCNLYPLLIHLLLFGKSYLSSIRQTLVRLA